MKEVLIPLVGGVITIAGGVLGALLDGNRLMEKRSNFWLLGLVTGVIAMLTMTFMQT